MSRDVMQQALDALEWVNDNTADEMPIVDAALFDLRCELDKPAAVPEGWAMVPKRLTAENGAKAALIGDFSVPYQTSCPECEGLDEDVGGCSTCNGDGSIRQELSISWPTIKNIWAKGIEHFAAAPQPPAPAVDEGRHPLDCLHINRGSLDAAADAYEAEFDNAKCREAFDNRYHKIKAAVSYDEWQAIWFKALEHERRKTAPAVSPVDVEAVRGTIFRMKDNHKLRESRCKPDPLISIWANELARAIGDEK